MNEWDLQAALTEQWLVEPPEIAPFGRLNLVAWELMFPSWDINYKTTRWNEPSLDFVFLTAEGTFVLVELKNIIPNRSAFLSAFCQVSHRAVQFVHTFSPEKLLKAFNYCMEGACQRSFADTATMQLLSQRIQRLPAQLVNQGIHRVIAAVSFPKEHHVLLNQFNECSFQELSDLIGIPPKSGKERLRFCAMAAADYDALRRNHVMLSQINMEKSPTMRST